MNPQEVIQSNRPGDVTTIWRDGEVIRCDAWGRCSLRDPVPAIVDKKDNP